MRATHCASFSSSGFLRSSKQLPPQAVAVGEHGVIEVFQQLVDSGRLVSHQGGKGLLGEAGEACAASVDGMDAIVADFDRTGDVASSGNGAGNPITRTVPTKIRPPFPRVKAEIRCIERATRGSNLPPPKRISYAY